MSAIGAFLKIKNRIKRRFYPNFRNEVDNIAYTIEDLMELQKMPLDEKVQTTMAKIMEAIMRFENFYVSFSGGKDSTVLADIAAWVCQIYQRKLVLVFSNTGLEYPEVVEFVKTFPDYLRNKYSIEVELVILKPEMNFRKVIETYGYPLVSKEIAERIHYARKGSEWAIKEMSGEPYYKCSNPKFKEGYKKYEYLLKASFNTSHKCCDIMKKKPFKKYEKETGNHPMVATMAEESVLRKTQWLRTGCNSFDGKRPMSRPMSFWTEQDVLQYLREYEIPYAKVYGEIVGEEKLHTTGCDRTGCVFCGFGCQNEPSPNRFERLKETHPKLHNYCMRPWDEGGLGMKEVLEFINVKTGCEQNELQ